MAYRDDSTELPVAEALRLLGFRPRAKSVPVTAVAAVPRSVPTGLSAPGQAAAERLCREKVAAPLRPAPATCPDYEPPEARAAREMAAWREREASRPAFKPGLVDVFAAPGHMPSFVYVIVDTEGLVKVGFSQNVRKRAITLQSGSGRELTVYASEPVDGQNPKGAEAAAHRMLAKHRVRGEWFRCHPEVALAAIRKAAFLADNGEEWDD